MAPSIGPGALKDVRVGQELESRVLLKDLLDYGDRAIREYEPPKPGPAQYVPENHWFFVIRRYVSLWSLSPVIEILMAAIFRWIIDVHD